MLQKVGFESLGLTVHEGSGLSCTQSCKHMYWGRARVFFFCCGPFLLVPRVIGFWKIFCCRPRVCKVFFFCCAPLGAATFRRGQSKKKKHLGGVFFFALAPCRRPTGLLLPLPFAGAAAKKKTPWVVFFFLLWPRAGTGLLLPLPFPGAGAKKNTLGGVFFFAAAPSGRSLTHCGPGWRCLPLAGVVLVFFAAALPGPGWCFFFCCGPARTLTHSRWAGAISARPGWCFFFFCCGPRRVFLDNNKKCLGYYIGSKKTRRGHSKKKKHHFLLGL